MLDLGDDLRRVERGAVRVGMTRIARVILVVQRGEEELPLRREGPTERARTDHPAVEGIGDLRAGLRVARKPVEDGTVPGPLLEHLRRRLDEVDCTAFVPA